MSLFTKLKQNFVNKTNHIRTSDTIKTSSVKSADDDDNGDSHYDMEFAVYN